MDDDIDFPEDPFQTDDIPDQEKILVIKFGALGEFIQAFGAMKSIRENHKNAHITLLTTEPFQDIGMQSPYCDTVMVDKKPRWNHIKDWMSLSLRLNEYAPARVYDLQRNDRTAMYFKLFKMGNRPEWVGVARGASHRHTSLERIQENAFDGHVETLALAGIQGVKVDTLEWMDKPIGKFGMRRPFILLVPGGASQNPQKCWSAEHYGRITQLLERSGYQIVIIGGALEESIARKILRIAPKALDLTAQTELGEITALARSAAGAIGNDTGPTQIIAVTGCPTLALFSPLSDIHKHRPKGKHVRVLQTANLETLYPEKVLKKFKPREIPGNASKSIH